MQKYSLICMLALAVIELIFLTVARMRISFGFVLETVLR